MKKYIGIFFILIIAVVSYSAMGFFLNNNLRSSGEENRSLWLSARPDLSQLRSGDLIFRNGRGFISNALLKFGQREKKYSHAGIVSVENGRVFVYHAIGGEENISNKLRKDPLAVFCHPVAAHSFGIFRTDINPAGTDSVMALVSAYHKSELQFDSKFDLGTDDRMYCTEFIYKIFQQVLGNENYISLSSVNDWKYVSCDDIYFNSHCIEIYQYHY